MTSVRSRSREHLRVRGRRSVVIAAALLPALGLGQAHAQEMGESKGIVPEVTEDFAKEVVSDPDVVFVRVLRKDATVERLAGSGKSASGVYAPDPEAVEFGGACDSKAECYQKFGDEDYIWITARISKRALGASAEAPITRVIPGLTVQVGDSTCWTECDPGGGSEECECVCAPPDECPR